MTFGQSIATCFRKYAVFSGRAGRAEFWWFQLFAFLVSIALSTIGGIITAVFPASSPTQMSPMGQGWNGLSALVGLAFLLPSLAVGARRLHDIDKSGWWQLLILACCVGPIILIVWWATRSTGPNRHGAGPEGPATAGSPAAGQPPTGYQPGTGYAPPPPSSLPPGGYPPPPAPPGGFPPPPPAPPGGFPPPPPAPPGGFPPPPPAPQ